MRANNDQGNAWMPAQLSPRKGRRERTAWCKPCKKATKYVLVGESANYIACEECGLVYLPVKGDQLGVYNELRGLYNGQEQDRL